MFTTIKIELINKIIFNNLYVSIEYIRQSRAFQFYILLELKECNSTCKVNSENALTVFTNEIVEFLSCS